MTAYSQRHQHTMFGAEASDGVEGDCRRRSVLTMVDAGFVVEALSVMSEGSPLVRPSSSM